jgi:nitrate/TMAO reductase-like tetraheme cytochrome c subunit
MHECSTCHVKLDRAATTIQKIARRAAVKSKFGAVLLKSKERLALREKLHKIKRKIAKSETKRKKELEKIEMGMESEMAGRDRMGSVCHDRLPRSRKR